MLLPGEIRVVLPQDPENPPEELLVEVVPSGPVPGESVAGRPLGAVGGVVVGGAVLVVLRDGLVVSGGREGGCWRGRADELGVWVDCRKWAHTPGSRVFFFFFFLSFSSPMSSDRMGRG